MRGSAYRTERETMHESLGVVWRAAATGGTALVCCERRTDYAGRMGSGSVDHVWIVCHDETPDNTVLGVFLTEDEASAYAEEIQDQFEDGVIYSAFPIGYRHIDQASRYFTYIPDE